MTRDIVLIFEIANSAPLKNGCISQDDINEIKQLHIEKNKKPKKNANPHYLTNRDLYNEVVKCKEKGVMSDKLARMLQLMCKRYCTRGSLYGYSYVDDMQAFAMMNLVKKWDKFRPERSTNAFSYFTQCIGHSIKHYLKKEKKEREKRDALIVEAGQTPSHTYQLDHSETSYHGYSDEY